MVVKYSVETFFTLRLFDYALFSNSLRSAGEFARIQNSGELKFNSTDTPRLQSADTCSSICFCCTSYLLQVSSVRYSGHSDRVARITNRREIKNGQDLEQVYLQFDVLWKCDNLGPNFTGCYDRLLSLILA